MTTPLPASTPRPRIAIIEDDADSALLAVASLSTHFDVISYSRGEDALAAFKHLTPAAIVLDIGLRRGMDGVQVLRTIRETPTIASIPVLALTAYASESMRERFIELGFDGYLAKPLQEPEQLLHAVQGLLAKV
jgi:CheY-like chemotaxis protein